MNDEHKIDWLVEIFIQYQEALDEKRDEVGNRLRFKDALDSDRNDRARTRFSASTLEA